MPLFKTNSYSTARLGFLTALFAIALAGCTGGNTAAGDAKPGEIASGDAIKIGLVSSLNGDLRPWGIDSQSGAQLAVDEANAAGGVNGKKIQLLVEDSSSKPEIGKSAAEKLLSEGVVCLVGEVASGITAAMADPAKEKKVPLVAVGATRTDLTANTNDVFRVCYTDKLQGPVMAKFAYEDLHLRRFAVMTDKKQPYSRGLSDSFKQYFTKLGGTIIDEEFYESGQTQFSGQLTQVKAKNPDGVFCSGYFTEVGPIVRQAREAGIGTNVKFLGGDGWDSKEILNSGGKAIVGSFFCNHYNNQEASPVVQDFLKRWTAKYKTAPGTTMGALGYDATKLVIDALKRAKTPTAADVRTAIDETVNFQGVSGVITLKGYHGNPPKRALVVQLDDKDPNIPQIAVKSFDYFDVFPEEKKTAAN